MIQVNLSFVSQYAKCQFRMCNGVTGNTLKDGYLQKMANFSWKRRYKSVNNVGVFVKIFWKLKCVEVHQNQL